MKHYVYKIVNRKSGSFYIGSRSHVDPLTDSYMGSSKLVTRLIEEQGEELFTKEIISTFDSRKEANAFENELVTKALQDSPDKCYNIRIPGLPRAQKQHNIRADIWNDYYKDIRREYLLHPNMTELARRYRTSVGVIEKVVNDIKIQGQRPDIWTNQTTIIGKYKRGSSLKELSKEYKCDIGTVRTVLCKNQVDIRSYSQQYSLDKTLQEKKKQYLIQIDMDQVKYLYFDEDYTINQIAHELKVHRDTLRRRMQDEGIEIRSNAHYRKKRHPAWNLIPDIQSDYSQGMNKVDICKKYNIKDLSTLAKMLNEEAFKDIQSKKITK